jgi:hypothetical protein
VTDIDSICPPSTIPLQTWFAIKNTHIRMKGEIEENSGIGNLTASCRGKHCN